MYKISGIEQTSDQLAPAMLYSCFYDSKQFLIHKFLLMLMSHQWWLINKKGTISYYRIRNQTI